MSKYLYEQRSLWAFDLPREKFILPDYQRGYVWHVDQALFLLDTMLHGLPVGSVLLWERPDGLLVIDGQQRISTLMGITMGNGGKVPPLSLKFDGEKCVPVVGTGPGLLPIPYIFKNNLLTIAMSAAGLDPSIVPESERAKVFRELDDWDEDAMRAFSDAEKELRFASIPALCFTYRATEADVREGFRRINLGGSPISPEQLDKLLAGSK